MGYQPSENQSVKVIESSKDLLNYFISGCKKPEEVRIGMEVEKHGIHKKDYRPVTYLEEKGIRKIQERLVDELNWNIDRQERKYITSMNRGGSHLTLEYCESMSELSGRTHPSIHDLARELRIHQHELSEMSRLFDVIWLGIGYQPFHGAKNLRRLKIDRFETLEKFYSQKSKVWLEHWQNLASVQANIDYISEDDAIRKFQILLRLSPFLSAMYAHSPLKEGENTGYVSYRTHILRKIDRQRFEIKKIFFSKSFCFEDWVQFCLRLPMITIFREGHWMPVTNLTFTQFLKSGYKGYAPTLDDWILHLSFIYTDVRIKTYIELRICDSLPPSLIPSLQAIVKGLVYHKDGERLVQELTQDWSFRDFSTIYDDISLRGMQAELRGKKMLDYCKEILNIATSNLRALKITNEKDEDESIHLEAIKEFVFVKEKSPGRWVMENWDNEWKRNPEQLIEWCQF